MALVCHSVQFISNLVFSKRLNWFYLCWVSSNSPQNCKRWCKEWLQLYFALDFVDYSYSKINLWYLKRQKGSSGETVKTLFHCQHVLWYYGLGHSSFSASAALFASALPAERSSKVAGQHSLGCHPFLPQQFWTSAVPLALTRSCLQCMADITFGNYFSFLESARIWKSPCTK